MQIKLKIDSYEDRNKMVTAIANAGIPVHVERVSGKDNCLHRFDYYVVFSHTESIEIEKECSETTKEYKIYEGPAGGRVFMQHYDGTYVECWIEDEPKKMNWHKARKYVKKLNYGGYSDWYLPTKDELNELYTNKNQIPNFQHDYYWSDTDYTKSQACSQYFGLHIQTNNTKNCENKVRAIRRFK